VNTIQMYFTIYFDFVYIGNNGARCNFKNYRCSCVGQCRFVTLSLLLLYFILATLFFDSRAHCVL